MSDPETSAPSPAQPAPTPVDSPRVWPISVPFVLMVLVTVLFGGMLCVLAFHTLPPENKDLFNVLLGSLSTAFITGIGYFWGSSSSSRAKDETITSIAKGATP